MSFLNKLFRKKNKSDPRDIIKKLTKEVFPLGQFEIRNGCEEVLYITERRIPEDAAVNIFTYTASRLHILGIRREFNTEKQIHVLKAGLKGQNLDVLRQAEFVKLYNFLMARIYEQAQDYVGTNEILSIINNRLDRETAHAIFLHLFSITQFCEDNTEEKLNQSLKRRFPGLEIHPEKFRQIWNYLVARRMASIIGGTEVKREGDVYLLY